MRSLLKESTYRFDEDNNGCGCPKKSHVEGL